jgi:hypothetical protein
MCKNSVVIDFGAPPVFIQNDKYPTDCIPFYFIEYLCIYTGIKKNQADELPDIENHFCFVFPVYF